MSSKTAQAWRLTTGNLSIRNWIDRAQKAHAQQQAFRTALTWAYTQCGSHYFPKWASYFLDEEFQAIASARLRTCYFQERACLQPAELARIWAGQMMWLSEKSRQQHIDELIGVAARFLRCLEDELCAQRAYGLRATCSG